MLITKNEEYQFVHIKLLFLWYETSIKGLLQCYKY
jgi:hypothetical protein